MHTDIQNAANIGQDRPTLGPDQGGFEPGRGGGGAGGGGGGGGAFRVNDSHQPETFEVKNHCLFPGTAPKTFLKEKPTPASKLAFVIT